VNVRIALAASDKDLVKELVQMSSRLKSLDECPEEELPQDQADAIFGTVCPTIRIVCSRSRNLTSSHLALVVSEKLGLGWWHQIGR
jgi:hypothetical protein